MVQIWDRAALDSTWVDCSAHSQSPQDCTELVLNTFLCFISLLREGRACERSRNCKTQMNGRKSNQATHTDIIVFSLMLLIIVWPMQTRSLIYRLLCRQLKITGFKKPKDHRSRNMQDQGLDGFLPQDQHPHVGDTLPHFTCLEKVLQHKTSSPAQRRASLASFFLATYLHFGIINHRSTKMSCLLRNMSLCDHFTFNFFHIGKSCVFYA